MGGVYSRWGRNKITFYFPRNHGTWACLWRRGGYIGHIPYNSDITREYQRTILSQVRGLTSKISKTTHTHPYTHTHDKKCLLLANFRKTEALCGKGMRAIRQLISFCVTKQCEEKFFSQANFPDLERFLTKIEKKLLIINHCDKNA